MTHLTPDELVDALERPLAAGRQPHLAGCDACAAQLAQLEALLADVRRVEVPEPSPLFWTRLSEDVRCAIAAERAAPPRLARWFDWPVLAPLGALAALVVALASVVPQGADDLLRVQVAMRSATQEFEADAPADPDAHWTLMAALIDGIDFDAEAQAGLTAAPGAADEAVLQLSSGEQQELARLLREELDRPGG